MARIFFMILFVAATTIVKAEPQAPTGDAASRVENKLKTTRTRDSIFSELRNKAVVSGRVDENNIRKAVTFYASFDESIKADYGAGERTPHTRFNHPTEKGQFIFEKDIIIVWVDTRCNLIVYEHCTSLQHSEGPSCHIKGLP